ncbi:hypothetical protein LTR53_013524 [Teratosphaeriaceae sp. CCFEE 6253]|nr:hypothetical protein LTR53_013524 [Teratosphaeriaceae sp. CCFEE 6253]
MFKTPAQEAAEKLRRRSSAAQDKGTVIHRERLGSSISTSRVLHKFEHQYGDDSDTSSVQVDYGLVPPGAASRRLHHRKLLDQVKKRVGRAVTDSWPNPLLPLYRVTSKSTPTDDELIKMALAVFPPRMELPVTVVDIGAGRWARQTTRSARDRPCAFGQSEASLLTLNVTNTLQSVEDMFLHDWEQGRPFKHAGVSGFPFVEVDSLSFQHREDLHNMREVYSLLSPMESIRAALDAQVLKGDQNETFESDLKWRADHLKVGHGFWDVVQSDIPSQLSEGISLCDNGPLRTYKDWHVGLDRTSISSQAQFAHAHPVITTLRAFHRADGIEVP